METWELKTGVEALLIGAKRSRTLAELARGLGVDEPTAEQALEEFEADLAAADRGTQVRRRAGFLRIEVKPPWAAAIRLADPAWSPRPISEQATETLILIAMKQPVIAEINAIRGFESAGTLETLRDRRLIARTAQRGPHREKYWRTTPLFLEAYKLNSLDDLYQAGALREIFPAVYSSVIDEVEDDLAPPNPQEMPSPAPPASAP
jgi:segregation and condensation protein B